MKNPDLIRAFKPVYDSLEATTNTTKITIIDDNKNEISVSLGVVGTLAEKSSFFFEAPGQEYLSKLLNGVSHYFQMKGLLGFIGADTEEMESFLRSENHVRVLAKDDPYLKQLHYQVCLAMEALLVKEVLGMNLCDANLEGHKLYTSLSELIVKGLSGYGLKFELLDLNTTTVVYSLQVDADDKDEEIKSFWKNVIQAIAWDFPGNNGREWVDKAWE